MLHNPSWDKATNSVRDTLLRAADLLEKRGHVKWQLKDDKGSMCALGAILEAQGYDWVEGSYPNQDRLTQPAATAICLAMGLRAHHGVQYAIADWNNGPSVTGADVIKAMRLAAEQVVEKEVVNAV